MEAYTYALRHRGDKNSWTMGPLFQTSGKAEKAAHELRAARSDKYSQVVVFSCKSLVEWNIQEPAPKPHGTRHKSHKKAPK